jgi:hypothetical protein
MGVIGQGTVPAEVPVGGCWEPGHAAIEEQKVGTAGVQVGVGEVGGADSGQVFGIEEPHEVGGIGDCGEPD